MVAIAAVLNYVLEDIDEAVERLSSRGVRFLRFEYKSDDKGVVRVPDRVIAWFADPAGKTPLLPRSLLRTPTRRTTPSGPSRVVATMAMKSGKKPRLKMAIAGSRPGAVVKSGQSNPEAVMRPD